MIAGVDVFSGYGVIDWGAVRRSGVRFAYVKCTEGNEPARNDVAFIRNVSGCKNAGIYVGGYHFAYPLEHAPGLPLGRAPREQAERAFTASGALGTRPGELPPVVDAEWPEVGDWGKWGCSAAQMSGWLWEYCEAATELWGRRPVIYTYPFWWRALAISADVSWAEDYALWIASYNHSGPGTPPDTLRPSVPPTWKEWLFWQYSAKGSTERIPGIGACPVDRDCFGGSLDDLRRLALIDPTKDTDPAPPPLDDPSLEDGWAVPLVHPSPFPEDPEQ